jgi:lipid-A-disaccharide synthase
VKYYIIAGEASGDLHGSNLMKELKKGDPEAEFRYWGGDLMQEQGGELVKHYRDLAFMGFIEVVMNLRTILKNISICKEDIAQWQPDVVILIDYPGFNLRIAEHVHKSGGKVFYYISPQVWAWKQSRVKKIKVHVDRMFVILPFEKEFYQKWDFDVDFVGHPLLDAIENYKENQLSFSEFAQQNQLDDRPVIALLPGSRRQEIKKMLPIMLSVTEQYPNYQFVIAGAPSIPGEFYNEFLNSSVKVVAGNTYGLLQQSTAALVTSGTATLETALFGIPEVVCYKGSAISYQIAKRLVSIDYISLVNLIMSKEVVKELIQGELTTANLAQELDKLLKNEAHRSQVMADYQLLKQDLGGSGASATTANLMLKTLETYQ